MSNDRSRKRLSDRKRVLAEVRPSGGLRLSRSMLVRVNDDDGIDAEEEVVRVLLTPNRLLLAMPDDADESSP